MSLFNFWKKDKSGHIEPTKEWPKIVAPELPISCIAQHIIDDLDIKNIDKWKLDITRGCSFIKNGKYSIGIIYVTQDRNYLPIYCAYLSTIDYKFNSKEKELFNFAALTIYGQLLRIQEKEYEFKNQEKLKELFPECFKDKND